MSCIKCDDPVTNGDNVCWLCRTEAGSSETKKEIVAQHFSSERDKTLLEIEALQEIERLKLYVDQFAEKNFYQRQGVSYSNKEGLNRMSRTMGYNSE